MRRELPNRVHSDFSVLYNGVLPWFGQCNVSRGIRGTIFLDHDGFAQGFANRVMLLNPFGAPGVIITPAVGVEVESPIVEGFDSQICREVDAFVS